MLSYLVAKTSSRKLRVEDNHQVHILAHRISDIAQKAHPRDVMKRSRLRQRLETEEKNNITYRTEFTWRTKWTGALYIIDNYGNRFCVQDTDLIRV